MQNPTMKNSQMIFSGYTVNPHHTAPCQGPQPTLFPQNCFEMGSFALGLDFIAVNWWTAWYWPCIDTGNFSSQFCTGIGTGIGTGTGQFCTGSVAVPPSQL